MRLLSALSLVTSALAIPAINTKGNAFFVDDGSNSRFYIRGVAYQPGGSSQLFDPLADSDTCERDIKEFKDLGINTIRVYSIDNTADHDDCMKQLADAGIYVLLDVNLPEASISRLDAECSYNTMYLNEVLATVSNMAQYNNTLGFFAGNEVVNDGPSVSAAPYIKAVVRDIKKYLKNNNLRTIPVGYSAADVSQGLETAEYLNCGNDLMARVDMYGFNDYSWCGKASFTTSGYSVKVKEYSNYSVPLFFSEFGCNTISPRPFTEIGSIYSTEMSSVFSGGLVYEYSQEVSNYGLVKVSNDNSSVSTTPDFDNLKSEYALTKNPSGDGGYQSSQEPSVCPAESSSWNVTNTIPDTPGGALKYIMANSKPLGNGFKASTQWACNMPGNDDASDSGSSLKSESSSKTSSASSSSSSSASSSSLSSKKSDGVVVKASELFGFMFTVLLVIM